MENQDIKILTQVVYKEHCSKALVLEAVDFAQIVIDTGKLIKAIEQCTNTWGAPFATRSVGTSRGGKVVGEPCSKCKTPYIQGPSGAYCKPCYIEYKNSQK